MEHEAKILFFINSIKNTNAVKKNTLNPAYWSGCQTYKMALKKSKLSHP